MAPPWIANGSLGVHIAWPQYTRVNETLMMLDKSRSAPDDDQSGVRREQGGAEVMFLDDLATVLRVSRSTIERRRRAGTFPIPELDSLDRRPRWSRRAVDRYLASEPRTMRRAAGRPRSGNE